MDQTDTMETVPSGEKERSSARVLAIVAIVIALTAPFWEGPLLSTINIHMPLATELADNARALDSLDHRTGDLEKQLGAVTAQLGKVQAQLNDTTARVNAAADRTATLAKVELVSAIRRSGGYQLELTALRTIVPDLGDLKPMLDAIEPYAVTGVPSSAQIRQAFDRINSRVQWTSGGGILSASWVTRLWPWQRAAAAAPADNTSQLLSQTSTQLNSGDLAGAVATVQSLSADRQPAFADWLEDAKARIAADVVLQRLNDQIDQSMSKAPQKKA